HPPPPATYPLSLHDALPISAAQRAPAVAGAPAPASQRTVTGPPAPVAPPPVAAPPAGLPVDFAAGQYKTAERALGELLKALVQRSEEHTSELQSRSDLVCRL